MQHKSSIQTERYCRSRAYGVFPTYSLRGYDNSYSRKADREKFLKIYLRERGRKTSILRALSRSSISTPWSPQSLTLTRFRRWKVKIAQGFGWGRKGGDGEGGARSNCKKGEWSLLTAVKRYLYLYNPKSPDQVRTVRETRTFRKKTWRLCSP
jgi:hypothetical protein